MKKKLTKMLIMEMMICHVESRFDSSIDNIHCSTTSPAQLRHSYHPFLITLFISYIKSKSISIITFYVKYILLKISCGTKRKKSSLNVEI